MSFTSGDKRNEPGQAIDILPKSESVKLTARQQVFCEEYMRNGFNGTQAFIASGYTGKHPAVQANALLKNVNVAKYLRIRKEQLLHDAGVNTARILYELASIAFSDIRELYKADGTLKSINELPRNIAACIESIESDEIFDPMTGEIIGVTKKVKLNSKLKAIEMLMRYKNLLGNNEKDNILNLNNFNVTLDLGGGKPALKLNTE